MPERDEKKASERPDSLSDFPEEFEQHPDAPSRDLARRARAAAARDPIVPRSEPKASGEVHEDAVARIEAMKKRVRELEKK
jgi:hypothetical protein